MECKQNVVLFVILRCSLNFGKKKKLTPALFVNDSVTIPLKWRPPKTANSESNDGRYYRNSTVHKILTIKLD